MSTNTTTESTVFDMSAFKSAISKDPLTGIKRTFGENNHPVLTLEGLGDNFVGLYFKLVRGMDESELYSLLQTCIDEANAKKNLAMLENIFVLVFQTRWTRGGKAEKKLTYQMFNFLTKLYPTIVVDMVELFPHFGYWKDLLLLLQEMKKTPFEGINYLPIQQKVYQLFADQLTKDYATLLSTPKGEIPNIQGYCAKWAPSEKKEFDKLLNSVSEICKILYPELVGREATRGKTKEDIQKSWQNAKMQYRNMTTALRSALEIPEVKMCANRWEEINIGRITSLCMNRLSSAFLNEEKGTSLTAEEETTGNRHPDREDRVTCRNNLLHHIVEKGISGKQLLPHEVVKTIFNNYQASSSTKKIADAQWDKVIENTLEQIKTRADQLKDSGKDIKVDITNMVPLSDVSGSMTGDPMMVSIALGILVSQIAHPAFKDMVMTFSEEPKWHRFTPEMSFHEKVQSLAGAEWGGSTDFEAAMNLIIQVIKTHGLTPEQVPNLLIVSDMQINQAMGGSGYYGSAAKRWATMYENIKAGFSAIGMSTPTIIFLNVRSGTVGFPAESDQEGTMLLSGWSPSVFKFLLSGEIDEEVEMIDEETGETIKIKKKPTPQDIVLKILSDDGLAPVREVLQKHKEELTKF